VADGFGWDKIVFECAETRDPQCGFFVWNLSSHSIKKDAEFEFAKKEDSPGWKDLLDKEFPDVFISLVLG
jgi:hypothetical protein